MTKPIHIVDSGAVSIFNQHNSRFNSFCIVNKNHRKGGSNIDYSFYKTPEFWKYVDEYAEFLKKWKGAINHYVTVDALRNPKLSWKIQKYLEKEHGLLPIPVIHFGTSEKWLRKYLDGGYEYIGLGGRTGRIPYFDWADRMWDIICDTPDRKPVCKVHGFAITTHKHMTRYPWYSVDSTTSKKAGYYGQILVPSKKNGEFDWTRPTSNVFVDIFTPYTGNISIANGVKDKKTKRHYLHLSPSQQKVVRDWLKFIKVPFGRQDEKGVIYEVGVTNSKQERVAANIKYFLWLQSKVPPWPWAWEPRKIRRPLTDLL